MSLAMCAGPAFGQLPTLPLPTLPPLPTTTVTLPLPTTTIPFPPLPTLPPLPTTTVTLPLPTTTSTTTPGRTTTTVQAGTTTSTTVAGVPGGPGAPGSSTTTLPSPTASEPAACTPATCDDANPCTEDGCDVTLGCQHVPLSDAACDDGDPCTSGDHCAAGVCSSARLGCIGASRCPETCTDDGFPCTDDVCTAAGCLHVPVDSRCVPPGECTVAVCAPELPGADAAGCVTGAPRGDGQGCAEDSDACTVDVCRGGECVHERQADTSECAPVQGVFRQTLALEGLTGSLLVEVVAASSTTASTLVTDLAGIRDDLAAAARALAGEPSGLITAMAAGRRTATSGIPAESRAHIAFTLVLRTPRQVAAFLQHVADAKERGQLDKPTAGSLRQGGRRLLSGTRLLRAELRRLQGGHAREPRVRSGPRKVPR